MYELQTCVSWHFFVLQAILCLKKTSQLWQAVVSTSMDWCGEFWINSISTLSESICIFYFPCPYHLYSLYLLFVKYLRRKWRDLKQRLIEHGEAYKKCPQISCWPMEKVVTCMCEGGRTSLWTSAKLKPALFRATSSLPRKTRCFASFPSQF